VDINRGDPQNGWDTDQFPNSLPEVALALYLIFGAGGFTTGGLNFDARVRRQSIAPEDLFHAHIGGMDTCARGLLVAARMMEDGKLKTALEERYSGWDRGLGKRMLGGKMTMEEIAQHVHSRGIEPQSRSGRQEMLENLANRYL
jgi:xylose isomerase